MQDEVTRSKRGRIEGGGALGRPREDDRELASGGAAQIEQPGPNDQMCKRPAGPTPTPARGAGQSSPPDGLGARRMSPGPIDSLQVNLGASRVRKPGFARP
jgi:hypothetical protein